MHSHQEQTYRFCVRCGSALAPKVIKPGDPERLVCQECGSIHYLDPKVSACSIIRKDNKLVLLKRGIEPGYGKWVFPGGYVDRGEKLEQAAIRETKEETGVDVCIDELVGGYSYQGSPVIVIVYAATILGGELRAMDEALEICLYTRDEIPWDDLAFPSTSDALKDYCRRFWPRDS